MRSKYANFLCLKDFFVYQISDLPVDSKTKSVYLHDLLSDASDWLGYTEVPNYRDPFKVREVNK